jgi:hypothetical protein
MQAAPHPGIIHEPTIVVCIICHAEPISAAMVISAAMPTSAAMAISAAMATLPPFQVTSDPRYRCNVPPVPQATIDGEVTNGDVFPRNVVDREHGTRPPAPRAHTCHDLRDQHQ